MAFPQTCNIIIQMKNEILSSILLIPIFLIESLYKQVVL